MATNIRRLDTLPADLAGEMPQLVRQKGTSGCILRWITIHSTTKRDAEDAPDTPANEAKLLAPSQVIVDSLADATLFEVPSIVLAEGHAHCREISMREFLSEAASDRFTAMPSAMFKRPNSEDLWDAYVSARCVRPWTPPSEENIVVLYDEPIEYVSFEPPTEPQADIHIKKIYDIQSRETAQFSSYVIGHALSKYGFFTFVVHIDANSQDVIRLGPIPECEVKDDGSVEWFFPDSYASEVCARLLKRLHAAERVNNKLSFKRAVQKVWKTLRVKRSTISNAYYKLDVTPLSLFHDIAIRRGYLPKDQEETASFSPDLEEDLDRRIRAGEQTMKVYEKNKEIPLTIDHGHRAIVERFLATREHQAALAFDAPEPAFRQHGKDVIALLRQARIIELPRKFYWKQVERASIEMYNAVITAMGMPERQAADWPEFLEQQRHLDAELDRECDQRIAAAMQRISWEPELPFPVCWLGYDTPIGGISIRAADGQEEDHMSLVYRMGANINPYQDGLPYLYGHLVTKDIVYAFFTLVVTKKRGAKLPTHRCFSLVERDEVWNFPEASTAGALNNIVNFLEDHQIVIDQMSRKRQDKTMRRISPSLRKKRHEPPPYYTVYIKDGVYDVKKQPTREGTRGPLTYSHDRAGGVYYRIRRGPLPLDKKTRQALERPRSDGHGYQIFEHEQPWGEWAEAVKKRGARGKGLNEWMAILKWRRRDTVVRPDLPKYIPSVRRSEKHKERDRHGEDP
jgi:hypothetical protein